MTQPAEEPPLSSVASAPGQSAALPSEAGGAKEAASAEGGEERRWGLSFYLFIEPFAVGKVVVDLAAGGGPGPELLRRAGAMEVLSSAGATLPLPFPDAGVDVLICGMGTAEMSDEGRRAALLAEIRRVLRRDGMAVVRVVASVLETVAAGVSPRAALADLALEHFSTVDIVEETPFRAVSFFTPGSDDLAVSEAMAKVGGRPSHLIALCTSAPERTWHLSESLLVPTGPGDGNDPAEGELAAWRAEVERLGSKVAETARERDELRERQMVVQDRAERLGRTVASLRKDVERYLRQISDDATARELLLLERDQLRRKLAAAQEEMAAAQREIESGKSNVQALRKEVARLRAARGTGTGRSP
jgi:SAM-dependent methyltransferase